MTVGWLRRHADPVALMAAGGALGLYLALHPPVPDLAAQTARAELVRRSGQLVLWLGWFGGVHLPTYSMVSPVFMALVGAPLTGAIAAGAAAVLARSLLRDSTRPSLGAASFFVTDLADVVNGRITFAVSLALGLGALVCLRSATTRWHRVAGVLLAVLTGLTSPLGGLFLGVAAASLALSRGARRRYAVVLGAALALVLVLLAVMFPGTGLMPFDAVGFLPAAACTLAVAILCRERWLRLGALLYLAAQVLFLVDPLAVGDNITRLAWVFSVPLLVAYGQAPAMMLAAVVALAALVPATDLAGQLTAADDPSSQAAFFRPLVRALVDEHADLSGSTGARVEVVDTRGHWASVYVARRFGLARGWERQADRALNPLFYGAAPLNGSSYRAWLDSLAVGWVAVPRAPLDYASVAEAALVARRPAYLHEVWSNSSWTLYRVSAPTPLAQPGQVLLSDDSGVSILVGAVRTVHVSLRWSPYLVVTDARGELAGCVGQDHGWTYLHVPEPGQYRVSADFGLGLARTQTPCATSSPRRGAGSE